MKAIELKEHLSEYLRNNGTESFTKLVSDAIDEVGAHHHMSIAVTRINFESKFKALSKLDFLCRY